MKHRGMRILAVVLMTVLPARVHAAENYTPLSVHVDISGRGTYVLENDDGDSPVPVVEELKVNGKGSWTIAYEEPGTYQYRIFNRNNHQEQKQVTVFVTNDEDHETEMNASVVFEQNGRKTDGSFPVPSEKAPQTGDRSLLPALGGMIVSLMAVLACLRIRRSKSA